MVEQVFGREHEVKLLHEYLESDRSEFIALYGRRRVGKTFLIRQVIGENMTFTFTGIDNINTEEQLRSFYLTMRQYKSDVEVPPTWFDAFDQLRLYIESLPCGNKIIFLDELPWMDTIFSNFVPALEHFWNAWASARSDIKLIVCGSATSWMLNNIINNHGGLYNRLTLQILLEPLSLKFCKQYFDAKGFGYQERELAELYMVFGGVPYYYSLMRKSLSVAQNIDQLIFSANGQLRKEKTELFHSLFRHSKDYITIINALSSKSKGLNRKELLEATKLNNNARFTRMLEELEDCRFIRHYDSYDNRKRQVLFQVIDPLLYFWHLIVERNQKQDPEFWSHSQNTSLFNTWSGLAFEILCLNHVPQIKQALGISGLQTNVYSWRSPQDVENKVQIDLLIDRADNCVNLCEMKYYRSEYEMTSAERNKIEQRLMQFQRYAEERKSIRLTMITSFGVKHNSNSYIVQNEVRLDDLFK